MRSQCDFAWFTWQRCAATISCFICASNEVTIPIPLKVKRTPFQCENVFFARHFARQRTIKRRYEYTKIAWKHNKKSTEQVTFLRLEIPLSFLILSLNETQRFLLCNIDKLVINFYVTRTCGWGLTQCVCDYDNGLFSGREGQRCWWW